MGERVPRKRKGEGGAATLELPPELVRRAPASSLVVGAVDDHAEHDADRVADEVLRRLATRDAATPRPADTADTRIRRRVGAAGDAQVGPAGGALDGDTAARIERARGAGSALGGDVRRRMETGFGTDLGHVRVHRGAEASALNESMGAAAFTIGNDVFVHDATPDPATPAGERVLAHEIAHTMQQAGGVHRLWNLEEFQKGTSEGRFTAKSTAQKAIERHLLLYREAAAKPISKESNQEMIDLVLEMRAMAQSWIDSHTVETSDGTSTTDPNRQKRMAGMRGFRASCDDTLAQLAAQKNNLESGDKKKGGQPVGVGDLRISRPSQGAAKVSEHYAARDVTSAFSRLGTIIDAAAPQEGDEAKISLSVKVPIPPGYLGFEFSASVAREEKHVSVSLNLGVVGGGSTAAVKAGGALGGYLKVNAKNGADAGELLSYALFRRCRQSNLIPREIENKLWGGASGAYGWQKAETWSLDVEDRIFKNDDKAFVETGGYGKVNVEAGVGDVVKLGGSATGTLGTRIDQKSLQDRKGGAGAKNLRSGTDQNAITADDYAKDNVRGAQKSVGVAVAGTTLAFEVSGGPLAASVGLEFAWRATGGHGSAKQVKLQSVKLQLSGSFTVPTNVSPLAAVIPQLVKLVNSKIQAGRESLEPDVETQKGGLAAEGVTSIARTIAGLATISEDPWEPFKASEDKAGTSFEGSTKYTISGSIGGEWDEQGQRKTVGGVSISQTDNSSLTTKALHKVGELNVATDVFKLEVEKTIRLCKIAYDGEKWSIAWAGNPYGK